MFRFATAVTHFPSLSRRFEMNANEHMFIEDVSNGVMPYVRFTENGSAFTARFGGQSDDIQRARAICRSVARDSVGADDEIITEAFRELAKTVSWRGKAHYEIVIDVNNRDVQLRSFTSQRLVRLPWVYLQFVPSRDQKMMRAPPVVVLPSTDVWTISIPSMLGGPRNYRRILRKIAKYDTISPDFWRRKLLDAQTLPAVDISGYRAKAVAFIRSKTRMWGWNMRDFGQELNTEYFTFYRYIRQHRARAVIRDHINAELNALFRRLGINASIEVEGLPSPSDCDEAAALMNRGEIDFAEVSARLSGS